MKLEIKFTTQFKKDLKLAKKQGKNIDELFEIVERLQNREVLDEKYRDHNLTGEFTGFRECHISPDWLLIYSINENCLTLVLVRCGSHSDLFN